MSDVSGIEKLTDRAGTGAPDFTNGFNVAGSDSGISSFAHTESANEPSSPSNGDAWLDTDNNIYKVYIDGEWKDWLGTSAAAFSWGGDRGFSMGGGANYTNKIERFDITTSGNAVDFADLLTSVYGVGTASNASRILVASGYDGSNQKQGIDYYASATASNAQDFGDLTVARATLGGHGDGTYGIFAGGSLLTPPGPSNVIDRVTVGSLGNATDFGDILAAGTYVSSGGDATRAIFAGAGSTNVIQYVTTANPGNAVDFGDMTVTTNARYKGECAGTLRTLFAGGYDGGYLNTIDFITPATTGNATDFGDLTAQKLNGSSTSNGTYGTFMGGQNSSGNNINVIERVTLSTAGNAADHGDLTGVSYNNGGSSGAAS